GAARGAARRLARRPGGRAPPRRPGDRRDAARNRAVAVADHRGVAAHDDDLLRVDAELGRAHLRQCGLVGLALRRDADLQVYDAARIDLDVGALEGPDAGALEIRGQPDADGPWRSAAGLLRGAPLVVAADPRQSVDPP